MSTPLSTSFTFFFSFFKKTLNSNLKEAISYEDNIKRISSFSSIEDFWGIWQHMVRPEQLPIGCEFFLFHEGIKPMWEDKGNENGGRFIIRIKKDVSNRMWEDIMLSFIGEPLSLIKDICGLILTVKEKEVMISVWVKNIPIEARSELKIWILKALELDPTKNIEFREHPKSNGIEELEGKEKLV